MDAVRDYLDCVNFHWFVIVFTGMYMHLREICLIGLCFEEENKPPFDPSYATLIFVFSTLCLIAEYKLWPRSLKEPPLQMLVIYEMLVAALVVDLVTRMIWLPLMHATWCLTQESSKALLWINQLMELGKHSQLVVASNYMHTDTAATCTAFLLSVLSFLWMLDATETLDSLLIDLWAKNRAEYLIYKHNVKSISFSQPLVAGVFTYLGRPAGMDSAESLEHSECFDKF